MSNMDDDNPFTDEQRESFNEALEVTIAGGHSPMCEHGAAMLKCIKIFADASFGVEDAAIVWEMIYIEMSLMLPPEGRADFVSDTTRDLATLSAAMEDLPRDSKPILVSRGLH